MNIAVLLTCHNRKANTVECLNQLYNQDEVSNLSYDVYLVDDGCTDGTGDAVRKNFPQVHVIKGNGELYWNRGMYLAWKTALEKGNYDGFLWLNDDTMLYRNALKEIFSLDYHSIVVGCTCPFKNQNEISYGASFKGNTLIPDQNPQPCDLFNGNIVFIPQNVVEKIGVLNPYYRHSIGDFEYARRAYRNNIPVTVAPILGKCDRNTGKPYWANGNVIQRFKRLYAPLGNNPRETFHYYKEESYVKAILMVVYIHIRVFLSLFEKQ